MKKHILHTALISVITGSIDSLEDAHLLARAVMTMVRDLLLSFLALLDNSTEVQRILGCLLTRRETARRGGQVAPRLREPA